MDPAGFPVARILAVRNRIPFLSGTASRGGLISVG